MSFCGERFGKSPRTARQGNVAEHYETGDPGAHGRPPGEHVGGEVCGRAPALQRKLLPPAQPVRPPRLRHHQLSLPQRVPRRPIVRLPSPSSLWPAYMHVCKGTSQEVISTKASRLDSLNRDDACSQQGATCCNEPCSKRACPAATACSCCCTSSTMSSTCAYSAPP